MKKILGVSTLFLTGISLIIGFIGILYFSVILSLIYAGIIITASISIVYAYCTKCACRFNDCSHVFPGKLACILPNREDNDYSAIYNIILFISLILLLGFPQFFLWHNIFLFIIFWTLVILSFFPIVFFLCRKCSNKKCALNRNK